MGLRVWGMLGESHPCLATGTIAARLTKGGLGCSWPHRRVGYHTLEGKHQDKAEAPGHFAWGHRGVSGAHQGLQNYELRVEVDEWVEKVSHRELQLWELEKVGVA